MNDGEPLLLDVPSAAQLLGLSERTTWSLISLGQLRSVKVGRRRLVPRHCLETFVDELTGVADDDHERDASANR